MPSSWLRKRFRAFKSELSGHLWLPKNKNRSVGRKNADTECVKSPVIRNDLLRYNKNDKNAYRDYSRHCEEVLFYRNNYALRCANGSPDENKPLNTETKTNRIDCIACTQGDNAFGRSTTSTTKPTNEQKCEFRVIDNVNELKLIRQKC